MKKKIAVYTCMTGNYDNIKEIKNKEKGIDYYCFTNNKNVKSNTWKVIYIEDKTLSNVELARKTKIMGTPMLNEKYDILVWMDAAVTFKKSIHDFINQYLNKKDSFVAFKHGNRNNIKEEMEACFRFNKEEKDKIERLMKFYEEEDYNYDNGLIESTVFIKRPKDRKVKETSNLWFSMIVNYTKRDQLSFNYCIKKTGLKVKWINEKVFDNDWFLWENHNLNHDINHYNFYYGDVNNYEMKNDFHYTYTKKRNEYIIDVKTNQPSNLIYINLNCLPCTEIKNLKYKNIKNIEIINAVKYKDKIVFFNTFPYLKITDELKENKKIQISFELYELTEQEKMEVVTQLGDEVKRLNYQIDNLNNLVQEKDDMIRNLSQKFYRKVYNKIGPRIRTIFKK